MVERRKETQANFLNSEPFKGTKEESVQAYVPRASRARVDYGVVWPYPVSIPRTRILEEQGNYLVAATGSEREIVVFDRHKEERVEFRYRDKSFDDPEGKIKNFWYLCSGITLLPSQIEDLKVLEGEKLERAGVEEIGGKAWGLTRLKKLEHLGFKVPDFFVIPTSFYHRLSNAFGFEARAEEIMASYTPDEIMRHHDVYSSRHVLPGIQRLFEKLGYFENFYPLFWEKMAKLGCWRSSRQVPLFFRSSSPLEDGKENSFPGVFQSYSAGPGSVRSSLEMVMLSPWSAYAEYYLRSQGLVGEVTRAMAVIVQEIPRDIRITGRIFLEGDNLEIEYVGGLTTNGDYIGNKVVVDRKLNIIEKIDSEERNMGAMTWGPGQGDRLTNEEVKRLANLTWRLDGELRDYEGQFNLEFALGESIYLLQVRPTVRQKEDVSVDPIKIKPENIITTTEALTGFSVGKAEGIAINLLDVDPASFNEEWLLSLDQEYPGAIYIVSFYHADNKFSAEQERVAHWQIMNERGHLLTPRKKGVIICSLSTWFHDHFTELLRNDPCFLVYAPIEEVEQIQTGEPIGIMSESGKRATIYRPEGGLRDSEPVLPSAEKVREGRYYGYWGAQQPALPGFKELVKKYD